MKLTLIRSSIAEGLSNIIRHPLVTMASITTIALMLILLGSFTVFSLNARHIMEVAGQQPPIEITMENDVTAEQLAVLDAALEADANVIEKHQFTPQENFDAFKTNMEDPTLFEDFPVENFPYTYTIRLDDPSLGEAFQAQISGVPGVRKVALELTVMAFLSQAIIYVNYATLIAFAVLGIISFFIISNMVRVAVFSRAEEINIMKYVGATNWYIRVPYIIEGAIVGLVGAVIAWLVTLIAYDQIFKLLMTGTKPTDFLTMVNLSDISPLILLINLLIGVGVGSLGSAVAVRRHIRV